VELSSSYSVCVYVYVYVYVCIYVCVYACFMIFGPEVLLCCLLKKKCHHSPEHLTTMILSNDQLSILQNLIEDGTTCSWLNISDLL
jgi:hypothetical protein